MLQRNCAGGIVFFQGKVLLLRSDKDEWVLPKGLIPAGALSYQIAKDRVAIEAGVESVQLVSPVGETSYEFYSMTRKIPVCNHITWYCLAASRDFCQYNGSLGFTGGGFYPLDQAQKMITYSQDRAIVTAAWQVLCDENA